MRDVAIGIDLATATARCVALHTADGTVLASASAALPAPVRDGSGSSTQQAEYARVATELIARVCVALGPRARSVGSVSVTGTSGTVVPCDASGAAIGAARLYDDTSGGARAGSLGVPTGSMLRRMASLQQDHPDAACFGTTADVVANILVGQRVPGDTSHWLKAGIDPTAGRWPTDQVSALGLDPASLPDLVRPGTVIGEVPHPSADAIGLPDGVVVVAGMTDGCTAQIATGGVHLGDTVGVLGTTLVLKAVSGTSLASSDGAVYSHLAPDDLWWAGGASNSGAGVLASQFPDVDLAAMDAAAEAAPSSTVGYPLSGVGERFPVPDPALRTLVSGVPTSRQDAYRAVLEGVAFVERLGLERLADLGAHPRRHVLAGGASRSEVWNRIRATVLAPLAPVEVTRTAGSAIGAAILAATRMTAVDEAFGAVVTRLASPTSPVTPFDDQRRSLDDSYQRFLDLVSSHTQGAPTP